MKPFLFIGAVALAVLVVQSFADEPGKPPADSACNGVKTDDWHAWSDFMPMSAKAVHVTGRAIVNSGGWKATLTRRSDSDTNSSALLLNLELSPPRGPTIQPILVLKLHYSETNAAGKFTRARVFCGDKVIADVPVEETH